MQNTTAQNVLTSHSHENGDFSLQTVDQLGKLVSVADSDEKHNLQMYCYLKCSNTDSDLLKQCRGVVFNDKTLVMKAFPYTVDYNHTELSLIEETMVDFSKFSFFDSYEGTLLRVFNFNGTWFLSTHRKLNAFRSKWSSKESYGTLFVKALDAEALHNPVF